MVSLLIENGLIVTMDGDRRILEDGCIAIENEEIVDVGKMDEVRSRYRAEKVIDAKGKVVVPGFICSHTHLYGMLLRAAPLRIASPSNFAQILERVWWPTDESLNVQDAYASALVGCLEFLRSGVTCFADTYSGPNSIHLSLDYIAKAVSETGIRGILSFEATERHSVEEGERGTAENVRFIEKFQGDKSKMLMGMLSLHASFTCSDEIMGKVRSLADKYRAPITIHASEGLVDLDYNMKHYGKRTVKRLRDAGLLGPDTVLSHCVHINDEEIRILKETWAKVAHNPMSNMLNAVGVAPIPRILEAGIVVGLGNDGYIFDQFENMRAAYLLHRIHREDPRVTSPEMVVEMATVRGAELYGLEGLVGSIEKGKRADIVLVDCSRAPTPIVPQNVYAHLVNTVGGCDVDTVLVNGRVLMEKKTVLSVKERDVIQISRDAAKSLWGKLTAR